MKKTIFISVLSFVLFFHSALNGNNKVTQPNINQVENAFTQTRESSATNAQELYKEMELDGLVNYAAFEQLIAGYNSIENIKNKDIVTLIDFSKASTEKRLFVLDIRQKKILFHSLVSHGKNSGGNYAATFSNRVGSLMSSLGFYTTENTYQGKNGYSLILNGLEKGINDKAKERAIVVHGANYCSVKMVNSAGRLGRSQGCPALPYELSTPIINAIKGGTLLYIYADNATYASQSKILADNKEMLSALQ